MFICKAEKIDSDEEVEGAFDGGFNIITSLYGGETYKGSDGTRKMVAKYFYEEIKPETLKISFDGGESWDSIDKVAEDIALCRIDNF
jgi:hypothetical protein